MSVREDRREDRREEEEEGADTALKTKTPHVNVGK